MRDARALCGMIDDGAYTGAITSSKVLREMWRVITQLLLRHAQPFSQHSHFIGVRNCAATQPFMRRLHCNTGAILLIKQTRYFYSAMNRAIAFPQRTLQAR